MTTKKTKKPIKEFTIDRAKWGTGALLNYNGSMCCLGFYLKACGKRGSSIRPFGMPLDVPRLPKEASWTVDGEGNDSALASELAAINDGEPFTKKKEQKVARRFAKQGITVKFVGEYPKRDLGDGNSRLYPE